MARYRTPPTCPNCGEQIQGKYYQTQTFFCGDTFTGWDWEGHICRIGTFYFLERTDTNEWFVNKSWTKDPMTAKIFKTKESAEKYLIESLDIPPRLNVIVTEHEFVRTKPAREKTLKDALQGLR